MNLPDDMLETAFEDDVPDHPLELQQPKVGRYVLLDRLGVGGMGTVFLAHDPELDRKVAIKLVRGGSSHGARVRMQREAQAMARVSHPNVAAVFDVGWFGKEVFLAMEYVAGGTIRERLAAGQHSWREVLDLFIAAGRGLAAAHAVGLVHRDFKPANVLLSLDGVAKVTDFGLVRSSTTETGAGVSTSTGMASAAASISDSAELAELASASALDSSPPGPASSSSRNALDIRLTGVGRAVGTPAYMAPEQFRGAEIDARSDQFSFCVALHEALWGVGPFAGEDVKTRLHNVVHDKRVPRPRDRDVPEWLVPILDRGLAAERNARWPSMVELLAALSDDPAAKRQVRRRWLLAGGLVLGLGGALWTSTELRARQCHEASSAAASLWANQSSKLVAAVTASAPTYAAANIERLTLGVEDWVERWSSARRQLCAASSAELDPSQVTERCLDAQLRALESLLIVLDERAGTPGVAAHAIEAIAGLPDPSACTEPNYAASFSRGCTPALELELDRAEALERAGLEAESLDAAETLLDSPGLDACPVLADQAELLAARLSLATGEDSPERVVDRTKQVLQRANRRDDLPLARAASLTLVAAATETRSYEVALAWLDTASLFEERLGSRPVDAIETKLARATTYLAMRADERATTVLRATEPLILDTLGPQHPTYLRYLRTSSSLERRRGNRGRALELIEQAERIAKQLYGTDHPDYVVILGQLALLTPEPKTKLARAERAVATIESIHGPDSDEALAARAQLGTILLMIRADERALEVLASLATRLEGSSLSPTDQAQILQHHGIALRRAGNTDQAEPALRRALNLLEAELGPEHFDVASAMINLANVVEERGRVSEAVDLQRRALAIQEREGEGAGIALLLNNLGALELELDQVSQAHRDLERAATIGRALLAPDSLRIIDYLTDLARAKLASQGPEPAGALFDQILAHCDAHPQPDNTECLYSRALAAGFILDHRPAQAREARALVERSLAAEDFERLGDADQFRLRLIHVRALAATAELGEARERHTGLVRELQAAPPHRHVLAVLRDAQAWSP